MRVCCLVLAGVEIFSVVRYFYPEAPEARPVLFTGRAVYFFFTESLDNFYVVCITIINAQCMNTSFLKEYRCNCGKLLFKGLLVISVVEVKCKRCGNMGIFDDQEKGAPVSFAVAIDGNGNIIDACRAVLCVGWERGSLVGKHLSEIFPLFRDVPDMKSIAVSAEDGKSFEIRNNTLLLRDGETLPAESYIVPRSKNGTLSGYYIFTVYLRHGSNLQNTQRPPHPR